jgi:predicted nucleotidyltransferase component of viral defense system
MHDAVKQMLKRYKLHSQQDYINALKEVFQEIALLGLWRAKFFEKAAFYGGSALRILYGLDRFSEDLDFSLLHKDVDFSLNPYNAAITKELAAFGFTATVQTKYKQLETNIESAFIKAETKAQLLTIEAPLDIVKCMHKMQTIKIKMEVDINPPGLFTTETKFLLQPIPFSVKSFTEPNLFAGKIHAILCRPWTTRVKGRDWYDLVWYISRNTPVDLLHLKERLIQSKVWTRRDSLDREAFLELLTKKIKQTDFKKAQNDVRPFLSHTANIMLWSEKFFIAILEKIKTTE